MKYLTLPLIYFWMAGICHAQISDDFSDNDFISNPVWAGDDSEFEIEAERLNSHGPATSSVLHLSTSNELVDFVIWEFQVEMQFAPSGSNKMRAYLVSDQSDLESDLNGYFVEIGQSGDDEIKFYRQDGNSTQLLFTGSSQISGNVLATIRVSRDDVGNWSVFSDLTGGTTFISEGDSFLDNTHLSTGHFGFVAFHTSTRRDLFYFDNVSISNFDPPFSFSSISVESMNSLRLDFSQDIDVNTSETISNYELNHGFGNPEVAQIDPLNPDQVIINFTDNFANNHYSLSVGEIHNSDLDETISALNMTFSVETQTPFRSIVINEIYADFNPSAQGIPDAEFLELLNASDQTVNLENFEINGNRIQEYVIEPGEYLIVTDDSDTALFEEFGSVVSVGSFPTLTNAGLELSLHDNLGNLVDSVTYDLDWYHDETKQEGGYTIEQINPYLTCNYVGNWVASNHIAGGTPGMVNSVFDGSPDTESPQLLSVTVDGMNNLLLTFNEPTNEESTANAIFILNPSIPISSVQPISPGNFHVRLELAEDFVSGTNYELTVFGVEDCSGNALLESSIGFHFDVEPPVLTNVSFLSNRSVELTFDETLRHETLNSSAFSINNGIASSAEVIDDGDMVQVDFDIPLQEGVNYVLSILELADTLDNELEDEIAFDFNFYHGIDTVFVISPNHLRLVYREPVQDLSALNVNNYQVSSQVGFPISSFFQYDSDSLVNLIFQSEFPENRTVILQARNIENKSDQWMPTPGVHFERDTAPPKLDSIVVASANSLQLVFNERLNRTPAESRENFEFNDTYPTSAQLSNSGYEIDIEFEEDFIREVWHELLIDNIEDLHGNAIRSRIKADFVYDIFPPQLDSIYGKSPNEVALIFNEGLDEATTQVVSNFEIDGIGFPNAVDWNEEFPHKLILQFGIDLPEQLLHLTVGNLLDSRNNTLTNPIEAELDNTQFHIGDFSLISDREIQLEFNKAVTEAEVELTSNFYVNGSIFPIEVDFDDRIGTLVFGQEFLEDSIYLLSISEVGGRSLDIQDYSFEFDPKFDRATASNEETVELHFESDFDQGVHFETGDFQITPSIGEPVSALLSLENPSVIRLTLGTPLEPDQGYTVTWVNLQNKFGNSVPNFHSGIILDERPPEVDSINVLNNKSLWLQFSEPLNNLSAEFLDNYEIVDFANPCEVSYSDRDSSVYLLFPNHFEEDFLYELSLDGIKDLANNEIESLVVNFNYEAPYRPQYLDLIITEIMAKPIEGQVEFFEVYNTSDHEIALAGLTVSDRTSQSTITSGVAAPGDYVLFSQSGDIHTAVNSGHLSSWLSLNNSGETLSIYDGPNLIFSTSYTESWYKSEQKEEGGYSLEMIDRTNPCGELGNWTGSTDPGGTPGATNSVSTSNPDNFGPELMSVLPESSSELLVHFDEKIVPISDWLSKVQFFPRLVIENISQLSPENTAIRIDLNEEMHAGFNYSISIDGVEDCTGNEMSQNNSVEFVLPQEGDSLDLIINEILFNPRGGGVDFVELFNNSDKVIDLEDWYLGDKKGDLKTISNQTLIIWPQEYLVLTTNASVLNADYPLGNAERFFEMNSYPSFNDDEDSVILTDRNRQMIDVVYYSEDFHFDFLDDEEGVSLERIGFDVPSNDEESWQSAASSAGFATPGLPNSQFIGDRSVHQTIEIEPKVFFPDNTGYNDFTTISYELDLIGSMANVSVFTSTGRPVRTLASNEFLSSRGFLTWDGTNDAGGRASIGYYVIWFEVFDALGSKQVFKETVVLGTRF